MPTYKYRMDFHPVFFMLFNAGCRILQHYLAPRFGEINRTPIWYLLYQNWCPVLVGEAGLEPARPQWTLEPESSESTNSTTRPYSPQFPSAVCIIPWTKWFVNDFLWNNALVFIVQHAVAVSFKIRILDLIPEFFAHAPVFFGPLQTAGAEPTGSFQSFTDGFHDFRILIQPYSHWNPSFQRKHSYACNKNGGESGIRTHGALPHHRFSRPAP